MDGSLLSSMSTVDFLKHMEDLGNRVEAAVNPLQKSQEELKTGLGEVNEKVAIIERSTIENKAQINELQQQMSTIRMNLQSGNPTANMGPIQISNPVNPPTHPPQFAVRVHSTNPPFSPEEEAIALIKNARRTLGFTPISMDDIHRLQRQYSTTSLDLPAMMVASVKEFLKSEMKVPDDIIANLVINKVFPPASQPSS